jgi:DNA-binding SARP family transcriptional activator
MSQARARHTIWDAIVGAAAALLVFGAVPGVLVSFVGLPIPPRWNGHDVVSLHGLFDLLAVVSWFAWAVCAWPILRSAIARVRARDLAGAHRLSDRIAVRIALGALAMSSFLGAGASVAGAATTASRTPVATAPAAQPWPIGLSASRARFRSRLAAASPLSHTVARGETLVSIAAARYDDPSVWSAIAATNLGRVMDDGTRFVDPSAISPGWNLLLPRLDDWTEPEPAAGSPEGSEDAGGAVLAAKTQPATVDSFLPLAEFVGAGISALVAALLARRSRQLGRLRAFLREEGLTSPEPDEREADLLALVAPFDGIPLVDVVEAAARRLESAIAALDQPPGPVKWMRAGRDGVEVRFSDPDPDRLDGWHRVAPSTWFLPAHVHLTGEAQGPAPNGPWCAALLPLGDDDRGTWLVPVEPGTCIAVVGPRAADLVLAMRAAVTSWSWHETLHLTDDPAEATEVAARGSARAPASLSGGPQVLFVGDPKTLAPSTRRACAVLATGQVDDAEVTVFVDGRGASAHPLGLTVRPPLLDASWSSALDALSDPPSPPSPTPVASPAMPATPATPATPASPLPSRALAQRPPASATLPLPRRPEDPAGPGKAPAVPERGGAEVRLLAPVPAIFGLQDELSPKRARRALEVVAYLAVHAPDPVTGDRLRTRVLGSAESDAAAKTLFNTVTAARQALGTGPDGQPLFPPASRSGHYRLSTSVTVDANRAWALIREGLGSRDPVHAVTRLVEGLGLVRGEPLGGVLTGYAWWRAEGHERRVADAVVDGACALVRTALESGDIDLARWALAQARKVEPYCEPLTRAAMRIAAASGDVRRLHAEWQECQRQMDELDPGATPSERTEQLYALLRAQLSGDGAQASFAAIDAAPFKTDPSAPSTV